MQADIRCKALVKRLDYDPARLYAARVNTESEKLEKAVMGLTPQGVLVMLHEATQNEKNSAFMEFASDSYAFSVVPFVFAWKIKLLLGQLIEMGFVTKSRRRLLSRNYTYNLTPEGLGMVNELLKENNLTEEVVNAAQ